MATLSIGQACVQRPPPDCFTNCGVSFYGVTECQAEQDAAIHRLEEVFKLKATRVYVDDEENPNPRPVYSWSPSTDKFTYVEVCKGVGGRDIELVEKAPPEPESLGCGGMYPGALVENLDLHLAHAFLHFADKCIDQEHFLWRPRGVYEAFGFVITPLPDPGNQ